MGKYIKELKIISGDNKIIQPDPGFERLEGDLNWGAGGKYIYLCYSKTDNINEAITSITFVYGENQKKPDGYDVMLNDDLNAGANGEYIYLCYRKNSKEAPILNLEVLTTTEEKPKAPEGYIRIDADLNKGTGKGNHYVYLCYEPELGKYIKELEIISDEDANIQPRIGFQKLEGDLNWGAGGKYIYLCYSKTDNINEAITSITFVYDKNPKIPDGYDVMLNDDLNEGAGGNYIYLCYRKKSGEAPILNLEVLTTTEKKPNPPVGYELIDADLNKGTGKGNHYVYLCYKPAPELRNHLSIKVNDVPKAFNTLPEYGVEETFDDIPRIEGGHIQGYTQYENNREMVYLLSHDSNGDYGYLLLSKKDGRKYEKIPLGKGWNHPGGIQAVGQYLFIPCEKDEKSKVFVYDIERGYIVKSLEFTHRAGCLGITDFERNGKKYYLLLIGDQATYYGYIAEIPETMVDLKFSPVGCIDLENKGHDKKNMNCQGMGLVTDTNGSLYMIAMMSYSNPTTFSDWAYCIKITVCNDKIEYGEIKEKHFTSRHNRDIRWFGTHFRYGAGIRVKPNGALVLLATDRKSKSNSLHTNYWVQ